MEESENPSLDGLQLVPDVVLFFVLSILCAFEYVTSSRLLQRLKGGGGYGMIDDVEAAGGTTPGADMRRWIQVALSLACAARGASLASDVMVQGRHANFRAVPDMIYIATYSLLALFLAQLHFTAIGAANRLVRPIFLAGLALTYVAFTVIVLLLWLPTPVDTSFLRSAMLFILATAYLVLLFFIVYFGIRICMASRRRKEVYLRMVFLVSVCSSALAVRAAVFLCVAAGPLSLREAFPTSRSRYLFEALFALCELLPSLAILVLTTRQRRRHSPPFGERSSSSAFQRTMSSGTFSPVVVNRQLIYGTQGGPG